MMTVVVGVVAFGWPVYEPYLLTIKKLLGMISIALRLFGLTCGSIDWVLSVAVLVSS